MNFVRTQALLQPHPRLMATPARIEAARLAVRRDALGTKWEAAIREAAVALLTEPVVPSHWRNFTRRHLEDERPAARTVLSRVQMLGIAYLWWDDRRFANRLFEELENAAALPDWNTDNFLDIAEMCHAFALGYDWLHDRLRSSQRTVLLEAMVKKGFEPAFQAFTGKEKWTRAGYGWNLTWPLVCNGGLLLAALSIAEERPDEAWSMIGHTLPVLADALRSFGPDGGWPEGPGNWCHAAAYATWIRAGLATALPSVERALPEVPGFDRTGDFLLHMRGPSGLLFNFADSDETHSGYPWLFWLAERGNRPLDGWIERNKPHDPSPHDLLWFAGGAVGPQPAGAATAFHFRGTGAVAMRGSWSDPDTTFLGIKGGDSAASHHCHLDLGSFVLDSYGERFATDLGEDAYDLPGYFEPQDRFNYYRTGTIGHNTLLINGRNQNPTARAKIDRFDAGQEWTSVAIDLSDAYGPGYGDCRVTRHAALVEGRHVIIADEISPNVAADIVWQMHTRARVEIEGSRASLELKGKRLFLQILKPQGANFELASAEVAWPQNMNLGIRKLVIRLVQLATPVWLAVAFSPDADFGVLGQQSCESAPEQELAFGCSDKTPRA